MIYSALHLVPGLCHGYNNVNIECLALGKNWMDIFG